MEEEGGVNLYAFVVNNGVNGWDLLGLDSVVIIKTEKAEDNPDDPWGLAAKYAESEAKRIYSDKSDLKVFIYEVSTVSEFREAISKSDIIHLIIIGHASATAVYVGSKSAEDTNISLFKGDNNVLPKDIDWHGVGYIEIWGCSAGSGDVNIAQGIANASGASVRAPTDQLNFSESNGRPFIRWHLRKFMGSKWKTIKPEVKKKVQVEINTIEVELD
jgi:hypothetical protein